MAIRKICGWSWKISNDPVEYQRWSAEVYSMVPGKIGKRERERYYRKVLKSCGESPNFIYDLAIAYPGNVSLGNRVGINRHVFINGKGGVTIGDDVLIGPDVVIYSANHAFNAKQKIRDQGHVEKPVVIEEDAWIAAGSIILPGVRIGRGAVIAAGSVVTKDVEPMTVVAGAPAHFLKARVNGE